jgi:hypothetical protein
MLDLLDSVLSELPALLRADGWHGLRIAYHPPLVERAWRPWRDCRLSIHRIHPCAPGEALLHPHPWPSAIRILSGRYEMAIAYGAGIAPPPIAARIVAVAGTSYAMIDPDGWHSVRPVEAPSLSVMLSGPPWQRAMPVEPASPQAPLSAAAISELLAEAARAA